MTCEYPHSAAKRS